MALFKCPEVYYLNGTFLVFDAAHAVHLRRNHILSQPVAGSVAAAGPHCLSPYAARMVAINGLATFKRLEKKPARELNPLENKTKYELKIAQLIDREKELFIAQRLTELRRHNVTPTAQTMKGFDETKLRIAVESAPLDANLSSFIDEVMPLNEAICLAEQQSSDIRLCHVYEDLFKRGFYLSSGMKFGSDFLAYVADPVRYHAQYAVRLVPTSCENDMGLVDLVQTDFSEINSLQRLTHTANKIPLFVTVTLGSQKVRYWTLRERVYLTPDSKAADLDPMEPVLSYPEELSRGQANKVRRTC